MKKTVLISGLFLMGLSVSAQNGGQLNENNSIKIESYGVTGDGSQIVLVTNKNTCASDCQVLRGPDARVKTIQPLASDTFILPSSTCRVTAKNLTNCGATDYGQVETSICNILPLRFDGLTTQRINPTTIQVRFRIVDLSDRKLYVQLSTDGITFKRVGIEVPASAKVGDTYIVNVKF